MKCSQGRSCPYQCSPLSDSCSAAAGETFASGLYGAGDTFASGLYGAGGGRASGVYGTGRGGGRGLLLHDEAPQHQLSGEAVGLHVAVDDDNHLHGRGVSVR